MNRKHTFVFSTLLLAGSSLAHEHNHMTVDTPSGSAGEPILIKAGYLPEESSFTIENGRLLQDGEIHVYHLHEQLSGGKLDGWWASTALLLTSDFFFATGRLDGGNFMWELYDVSPVNGGEPPVLVWGEFDLSGFTPLAISNAADRKERSFDTMIAGHNHEQGFAIDREGIFDLTFIVWDSNGKYADSEKVTIRIDAGPLCYADCDESGLLDIDDFICFQTLYALGEPVADCDESGSLDIDDFICFQTLYAIGC